MAIQENSTDGNLEQMEKSFAVQRHLPSATPSRIKVIGVGSGGCNCVKRMMKSPVPQMTFAAVNTDYKALGTGNPNVDVIQISESRARAWESGEYQTSSYADDSPATDSFDETSHRLRQTISGSDLVFVTAGMGGGTGTGAIPYVARLAKEQGALVVGLVTAPFSFEGRRRMGLAVAGVDRLRPYVDNLILIHNDRLLSFVKRDAEMVQAFHTADETVTQGIMSLSEAINVSQEINVDLAGMRSIMGQRGGSFMAIGSGAGSNGPVAAAMQAIANPLLDLPLDRATGVLMMVRGGPVGMTLGGVNAAWQIVTEAACNADQIVINVGIDETLGEGVRLTLIATGIKNETESPSRPTLGNRNLNTAPNNGHAVVRS